MTVLDLPRCERQDGLANVRQTNASERGPASLSSTKRRRRVGGGLPQLVKLAFPEIAGATGLQLTRIHRLFNILEAPIRQLFGPRRCFPHTCRVLNIWKKRRTLRGCKRIHSRTKLRRLPEL
jgi:adenylosuccinate synthase